LDPRETKGQKKKANAHGDSKIGARAVPENLHEGGTSGGVGGKEVNNLGKKLTRMAKDTKRAERLVGVAYQARERGERKKREGSLHSAIGKSLRT